MQPATAPVAASLARALFLRFALAALLALLATAAVVAWQTLHERQVARDARLDTASGYFRARLAQTEEAWAREAHNTRTRIEFTRLLEGLPRSTDDLVALMAAQGSSGYAALVVTDGAGRVLFAYPRTGAAVPEPPVVAQGPRWAHDAGAGRLYRVHVESAWLGPAGTGRLHLYRPVDNALLDGLSYPGVELLALWEGRPVASSLGTRALQEAAAQGAAAEGMPAVRAIAWPGQEGTAPQVRLRLADARLDARAPLLVVLAGGASIALLGWAVLGRWMRATTRRIDALAASTAAFAGAESRDAGVDAHLAQAQAGRADELAALAGALRQLMDEVTRERRDLEASNRELREKEAALQRMTETLEATVAQRTAELAAANKELEAFAYSVSHDLRTPLRSIDGFCEVLLTDHGARMDDECRRLLGRVRAGAERMGRLITDLLELSRVTRAELRTRAVDLSALAGEIVAELDAAHPQRRIDWRIAPGLVVDGDPGLLRLALTNLLDNARKYSRDAARPCVELLLEARTADSLALALRDNGAGFDMAYAGMLFQPFRRLHSAHEFEGTGVGLAVVERVLSRHGGTIRGEGRPGAGATFHFTLPAASHETRDAEPAADPARR
jgi:signal transduction histidine kinase